MRDPVVLGVASAALFVVAVALLLDAAAWPSHAVGGVAAIGSGYFATAARDARAER